MDDVNSKTHLPATFIRYCAKKAFLAKQVRIIWLIRNYYCSRRWFSSCQGFDHWRGKFRRRSRSNDVRMLPEKPKKINGDAKFCLHTWSIICYQYGILGLNFSLLLDLFDVTLISLLLLYYIFLCSETHERAKRILWSAILKGKMCFLWTSENELAKKK